MRDREGAIEAVQFPRPRRLAVQTVESQVHPALAQFPAKLHQPGEAAGHDLLNMP